MISGTDFAAQHYYVASSRQSSNAGYSGLREFGCGGWRSDLARTLRRSCQRYYAGGESAVRPCPVVLFDRGLKRGILLSVSPSVRAVLLSVATPFHGRI